MYEDYLLSSVKTISSRIPKTYLKDETLASSTSMKSHTVGNIDKKDKIKVQKIHLY